MKMINVASTHLCPSCPLRSHQSMMIPPPYFYFLSLISFVFLGLCFFSSNHVTAFVPHPQSPLSFSVLLFHSFIFYCLNSNRQNHPTEPELFLIIIFLPASICIPLAFLPLGILLLSLPLSPCTPPSLSMLEPSCLFLLSFFSPLSLFACAPHCSPISSSPIRSLRFLYFSFSPTCFFLFPPAKSCNEV